MPIVVREGTWEELRELSQPCRRAVFVDEQHIPEAIEFDDRDAGAIHLVVIVSSNDCEVAVGNARLLPDGHIGRVCVLASHRRSGVGRLVMQAAMRTAKARGHKLAVLESQLPARNFYESLGFQVNDSRGVFPVSGLPHVEMQCLL